MSDNKFNEFQQRYPNLFKEYPRSGFYLETGWEELVNNLCSILEFHIKDLQEEVRANVQCAQLKQKFGSLRFYMTQETPYISGAIAMAERISTMICEKCGAQGEIRLGGWVQTLCEIHFKERNKRK